MLEGFELPFLERVDAMTRSRVMFVQVSAALVFSCFLHPAFATLFTVGPGSTFTVSGNLSVDVQGSSGSGTFVAQAPGSLSTNLSGTIDANAVGSTLNFTGGTITANNSGNWQPSGLPGAFGFQTTLPLTGGPLNGFTLQITGDIRQVQFNFTGSVALSGSPADQTFNTAGLALNSTSGILSLHGKLCGPSGCTEIPTTSDTIAGPPPDILPSATGHLSGTGSSQSLSFPFSFSDTESDTDAGVTATLSGSGSIMAAAIPEPATWMLLLVGVVAIAALHRGRPAIWQLLR